MTKTKQVKPKEKTVSKNCVTQPSKTEKLFQFKDRKTEEVVTF